MKFRIKVSDESGCDPWWETVEKTTDDQHQYAEGILEYFNATLKTGETKRTLLAVEITDADAVKEHTWEKQNNFTIQDRGGGLYDVYRCSVCRITANRYGIGENFNRDRKFKPKVYARCDTSLAHRQAKGEIE